MNARNHLEHGDVEVLADQARIVIAVGNHDGKKNGRLMREELRERIYGEVRSEARRILREILDDRINNPDTDFERMMRPLLEAGYELVHPK